MRDSTTCVLFLLSMALLAVSVHSLKCYTGFKLISGQTFGGDTKECEDNSDYCYNMTASAGILLSAMKAGCSTYRCFLSRDTCRSMDFQGVPVSFCCCSTDLCNSNDNY
uniref:Activin_recp domain-containing protein n=1 Tax=Panagrellus redivivus TaxID=6233 RepID=A0A7E4UPK9_PANRE